MVLCNVQNYASVSIIRLLQIKPHRTTRINTHYVYNFSLLFFGKNQYIKLPTKLLFSFILIKLYLLWVVMDLVFFFLSSYVILKQFILGYC